MGQRPLLQWGQSLQDVRGHARFQRQLLRAAAELLRVGGDLVYSTCTLLPEENEENVRWALDVLPLELLDAREHAFPALAAGDGDALAGLADWLRPLRRGAAQGAALRPALVGPGLLRGQ
ncbi:unnamed protein product, partial [Prorocentrum cordatum]